MLTLPPEVGGWQRQRVAVRVRDGKGPRNKKPGKAGVAVHDRRFPHSLTLMAKGTEGCEVKGLDDALKSDPGFVSAKARRVIDIVDDEVEAASAKEKPQAEMKASAPSLATKTEAAAQPAEGSTER